jgi:hypothetical protein
MSFDSLTMIRFRTTECKIACAEGDGLCAIEHFAQFTSYDHLFIVAILMTRADVCVGVQIPTKQDRILASFAQIRVCNDFH